MIVDLIVIDDDVVVILICELVFVPIVWGTLDACQQMVEEVRLKVLFKYLCQYLVTAKRLKSHVESAITLVFDEPLREVFGSRTLLGHPVLVIRGVWHVIHVRLWM